jgi:hypothetical protein
MFRLGTADVIARAARPAAYDAAAFIRDQRLCTRLPAVNAKVEI